MWMMGDACDVRVSHGKVEFDMMFLEIDLIGEMDALAICQLYRHFYLFVVGDGCLHIDDTVVGGC